jgi:hypothetical protein
VFIQVLVNEQVEMGARVVEALRKNKFPISAAFWYRLPESGFWRLVIGSRLVDKIGPLEGYRRLHAILAQMGLLALFSGSISLLGSSDPDFRSMRSEALGAGQFNAGPRLAGTSNSFQDAYVYSL